MPGAEPRADAPVPVLGQIAFVTADPQAPSFRYRLAPLGPLLAQRGWQVRIHRLAERWPYWRIWALRQALQGSHAVVLHKLRLSPLEARWLHAWQPASWFDLDDAIWLRQPKWVGHQRPPSARRRRNFEALCAQAAVTSVGNQMLAGHARAAGGRVQVFPTAIDAQDHPHRLPGQSVGQVIAWVGLPGNLKYLDPLRPVLASLARQHPAMRLRVISSRWPDWTDVPIERVPWAADTERPALSSADIGIMPLSDDEYSRGKCAFKLLQYMAAGLPCVASPVGANNEVVLPGRTGLLASTPAEWGQALQQLLAQPESRLAMGQAGRARALALYDTRVILPAMADQLALLARHGREGGAGG